MPESTDDPEYNIIILKMMINELPDRMREPISQQFDKLLGSIDKRNKKAAEFWEKVKSYLKDELTSIELDVAYIHFDLEATRRERDKLRSDREDTP